MKAFLEFSFKRPIKKFFHLVQSQTAALKLSRPASKLKLIAVTGTSGKSSTSAMIYHVLKHCGFKVGLISTVEAIAGNNSIDTGFHTTTPDAAALQNLLRKMRDEGMEYVVIETSSHAIEQGRLGFLKFDYAVYTNIKKDHLDWHVTWENYAKAKAKLINKLTFNGKVIVNVDDKESYKFLRSYYYALAKNSLNFLEYSREKEVREEFEGINGLMFKYENADFSIPVVGDYNIDNALAAIKLAEDLNIDVLKIAESFKSFRGVKGRMEIMQHSPFLVVVDFAHNADSLERSLKSLRKIKEIKRIITVFGSAGLRDIEKRFEMGKVSAQLADITIITAEDPRTEKLFDINTKIIEGAEDGGSALVKRFSNHQEYSEFLKENNIYSEVTSKQTYAFDQESIESRMDAIEFACMIAKPGDVVITEGKGHEKTLCFGTTEFPFSDQQAVQKALE